MKSPQFMPSHAERQESDGGFHAHPAFSHGVPVDRNGLEVLTREECLRLLGTQSICRVGITVGALPAILPVNFVLHDDLLFIRAVEGRNLHGAMRNTVVAVEADQIDEVGQSGWSVLVRGNAYEVTNPDQLDIACSLGLHSWIGDSDRLIAVHAHSVSGRRIVPLA